MGNCIVGMLLSWFLYTLAELCTPYSEEITLVICENEALCFPKFVLKINNQMKKMLRRALEDHFAALICIYQGYIHERERNDIVFGPIKLLQQNI